MIERLIFRQKDRLDAGRFKNFAGGKLGFIDELPKPRSGSFKYRRCNQADLSERKKNEARSLLRKLLGSKAAASVLGAGAQSLAAKYFTG